jgi:glucose/mannose transport system permease protein
MGKGPHKLEYEVIEGWEQLPDGWSFVEVAGVAVDSQDRVYVFNRGEHPMIVFDKEGKFLNAWGEGVFRSIYLFPMAVSFIAAGVVWRWLMNPAPGDRGTGLNLAFDKLGLDFLTNEWFLNPSWGAAALALPAIWALTGYIMALYLAGFRGVPEELREAARMDGASEYRVYRHVVFPHLRPVTLAALIILGHISIKVFDLIVAIGGKQLITEVPAVYMWVLIYDARDYAKGAAIATLLLVGISVLIIPYLIYTVRQERRA